MVIGIEIAARLSIEHRKMMKDIGFLQSSVLGIFGATAAACRLFGLSVKKTINAFGIAYSQASGNRQALFDTTLTKRIQPAFAAKAAIYATCFASRGFTGPTNIFEGKAGLYRIYGCQGEPPKPEVFEGIKDVWEIEKTSVKRYPSCGAAHPISDLALKLVKENDLKPDDVEKIDLYLTTEAKDLVGIPFKMGEFPQVNAQFNAPFAAALAFTKRSVGVKDYDNYTIQNDVETQSFIKKINVYHNDDLKNPPTDDERIHTMHIHLKQGKSITGSMGVKDVLAVDRVSYENVEDKFRECADYSKKLSNTQINEVIRIMNNFEKLDNISNFIYQNLISKKQ
jgi:2-methylcitrate dehydratase PrpD